MLGAMTEASRSFGTATTVRRFVLGLVGVAAGLTVVQAALIAMSWSDATATSYYWRPAALIQALIAFEFAVVGGLIAVRRPENRIGWLLVVGGVGLCVYSFVGEYALRGEVLTPGSLPWSDVAALLTQTTWALPFGMLPPLLLLYPTGRPLSPRWWPAVVPGIAGAALLFVFGTISLWRFRSQGAAVLLQTDAVSGADEMSTIVLVGTWLLLASVLPAVASVVVRWRRARGVERLQLRWLVPAGLLIVAGSLVNGLFANGSSWGEIALLGGLFSLPAAIAVAVLRYRLYDIDRIISRVLSYAVVTGVLGTLYVTVAVLPSTVLNLDSNLLVAAATLAAAAAFVPVRRRVQTLVDRRFNRSRYDANVVVERFKARTRDQVDLDGLVSDLSGAVALAVQPSNTAIWIRERS